MKVFIKTYGCQMNMRDSEAMAGMLAAEGYDIVSHENDADISRLRSRHHAQDQNEKMRRIGNLYRNREAQDRQNICLRGRARDNGGKIPRA